MAIIIRDDDFWGMKHEIENLKFRNSEQQEQIKKLYKENTSLKEQNEKLINEKQVERNEALKELLGSEEGN